MTTAYKIRDCATGLYQLGGMTPAWSKVGKTWNTKGQVKAHLRLIYDHYSTRWERGLGRVATGWQIPDTWEVLEVEVTPTILNTMPASEFYPI